MQIQYERVYALQIKMNMISFFIAIIVCLFPIASVAQSKQEIKASIKGSDNYKNFEGQFLEVSEKAIRSGKCTLADFKNSGGWAVMSRIDQRR